MSYKKSRTKIVAAGYDLVFLLVAGIGLAIAVVSFLLPRYRRP